MIVGEIVAASVVESGAVRAAQIAVVSVAVVIVPVVVTVGVVAIESVRVTRNDHPLDRRELCVVAHQFEEGLHSLVLRSMRLYSKRETHHEQTVRDFVEWIEVVEELVFERKR